MNPTSLVDGWLNECRPKLPIQNPLWAFIHNNILLNLEDRPFREVVREAAALYRARPYETEAFYRSELARGRIRRDSLDAVLAEALPGSGPDRAERFLADPAVANTVAPVALLRLAPRLDAGYQVSYDRMLQDFVVPLIASFLDQGMAAWTNPFSEGALWGFFLASVHAAPGWGFDWAGSLKARVRAYERAGRSVDEIIEAEVREAAPEGREAAYCLETLFALKGWSGMVMRLEAEPALAPVEAPHASLKDWLAVMLVSSHALDAWLLERHGLRREELSARPALAPETASLGRLHLWQEAYERSFAGDFLSYIEEGLSPDTKQPVSTAPRFQALMCMDDREESMRRALESKECGIETWGYVGFFNVDMRFEAVGASRATRQCPPVIEPSRTIQEVPLDGEAERLARARSAGRAGGKAQLLSFYHSRTLIRGFFVSLALGLLSFLPLVLKVLMPSRMNRLRRAVQRKAFPHPRTSLALDAQGGYSLDEQATIVEGALRTVGLTRLFAPLVAVVAHGSTNTNNPFRQAYGCGACSGNPGEPNARAFVTMANRPEVRERLAARGLPIPATTLFVPCYHDTSLDIVEVLDRDRLPAERLADVAELEARMGRACRMNAVERCQRFGQGPRAGAEAAAQHVLDRGHDLSQPRPEYGHNRVAACIVGRRELTAQRFLDRRSFLVSYDPTQDQGGAQMRSAILGTVPVAVNIAMDYYFSRVDNEGFGAGSKLPLNVVSLLGVLTGSKSDLRIGLARQMVELHEPMRILVIVEAAEKDLRNLIETHPRMRRMVQGEWMRLGRIDPSTRGLELWDGKNFVPWRELWREFREAKATALPPILDPRHDRPAEVYA
ncbi:DUF2309 domain-containing protein [Stigmatella sp. ncwal1]|uniref:Probable inorganic carbon transporter subunit DabA n=1 Tax=Stigmatella ashevillensis TaxID=2995309 RepID=A0ABT5D431_9BACT|nr:DUF2309 domain-containing protein [Stigmatella ashevillena]MDC0707840.1 DUF2309 domain-containing protein [Stigmatella ashevillena]